jgi:glycosyltransferase involved in cell wall biosynthesis
MRIKEKLNGKIALFVPTLSGGGAEKVMVNLAYGFLHAGQRVDFVVVRKDGPYINELPADLNIVDLGARYTSMALLALRNYIRSSKPDVLLSAMNYANVVALWAKKISRVKTLSVITEHSTFSAAIQTPPNLRTRLALPTLMRLSYPLADEIVAVSRGVADDLVKHCGIPEERITVIHNPIRFDDILEKANDPVDHPWYRPGMSPVLLSVGRLHRAKDYPNLLRAFSIVRKKANVRLLILGEGEERSHLNALTRHLNIEQDVDMPGFQKNPYNFMASSKVFVLSSKFESFSNVLLEAIACGCPVVSTDCPHGPKEIFEMTGVGRLVPVAHPELLADAILEVLQDGEKKKPDLEAFRLEKIVKQYMEVCSLLE